MRLSQVRLLAADPARSFRLHRVIRVAHLRDSGGNLVELIEPIPMQASA